MRIIALEKSDLMTKLLKSIIEVIGRRSSPDYALIMIGNTKKKVQQTYGFFQFFTIKPTLYSEIENVVTIDPSINKIKSEELSNALKEFLMMIVSSMGKNAGFFFVKEIKNKIGPNYVTALRKMGLDLDFIQFNIEVEKKQKRILTIENSDVIRRVLKTLLALMEEELGRDFAVSTLKKLFATYGDKYVFLKEITVVDIRYSLGENEINIKKEVNTLDKKHVGNAIQDIFNGVQNSFREKGRVLSIDEFRKQLTFTYKKKLNEMGVNLQKKQFENSVIYTSVLKALLDVISQSSTQQYAVFAMNSFLKNMDDSFVFLKDIAVNAGESDDSYTISIMTNLDKVSETDIRRSLQKLLQDIIDTIGTKLGESFIHEFKESLDKKYLVQLEEIGVNLHLLQLRQYLIEKNR